MNFNEQNQKPLFQNQNYIPRKCNYKPIQLNNQIMRHRASIYDKEDLINQLIVKQEQINNFNDENKNLHTQIDQLKIFIKDCYSRVQNLGNSQNFNDLGYREGQNVNRKLRENNQRRLKQIDKQDVEIQLEKIKNTQSDKKINGQTPQNKQKQLQFQQDVNIEQDREIEQLREKVNRYEDLLKQNQILQQQLNKVQELEDLQNIINELQKMRVQVQVDLNIVRISYQLKKQSKANNLQITKYRSISSDLSTKSEIEIIQKDFRSKSTSQDNKFIVRNFQLIKSLEKINVKYTQKIKYYSHNVQELKNQIVQIQKESEQKDHEIKKLHMDAQDQADKIKKQQNDLEVKNIQNNNLKKLILKNTTELAEQKQKIDSLNSNLQAQLQNIEKLNEELKQKNLDIEQLKLLLNQKSQLKNRSFQMNNQVLEKEKQEKEQLKNELRILNSQLFLKNQENQQINSQIQHLNEQLNEQISKNEQLNEELKNSNQIIKKLKQENEELNEELKNSNQIIKKLKQENEELNEELKNSNQIIKKLKQENEELNEKFSAEINNLNQQIREKDLTINNLQSSISSLNNIITHTKDQILDMQIDLDSQKTRQQPITLMVKSVNSNRSEKVSIPLMNSINDLYVMFVLKGIHTESPINTALLVPSKNKRINSSDWMTKFYDIFIPNDYNQTILLEFTGVR